ncbi:MAG: hypothetical protein KGJ80_13515, partial [Chloroflexota bacterium]|nr:hypothetical protein [Chloroflexota bacterium]
MAVGVYVGGGIGVQVGVLVGGTGVQVGVLVGGRSVAVGVFVGGTGVLVGVFVSGGGAVGDGGCSSHLYMKLLSTRSCLGTGIGRFIVAPWNPDLDAVMEFVPSGIG